MLASGDLEEINEKITLLLAKLDPEIVKQVRSQDLGHITEKGLYNTLILLGCAEAGSSIDELAEMIRGLANE